MAKSIGFSCCPQTPSAFIKLIVQGAIFDSNHLDGIRILHTQNLAEQTSEVNKNDRLFIYTSLVGLARPPTALYRDAAADVPAAQEEHGCS
jgi:hypothetical protein